MFRPSLSNAFAFAVLAPLFALLSSCAGSHSVANAGFADKQTLDSKDNYVISQSTGGMLDPLNMAQEDQRYNHDGIAYNRVEEGYYQWGQKLYQMGYRDEYYVRDLAPHAFKHDLIDTYDHAIQKGYEDAESLDKSHNQ